MLNHFSISLFATYCGYYIFSPILLFAAADLKIWFKVMRTRYCKLTAKKFDDGTKEHTERDNTFTFLEDHSSCVPQAVGHCKHSFLIYVLLYVNRVCYDNSRHFSRMSVMNCIVWGKYFGKFGWSVLNESEIATFGSCIATVTLYQIG